MKRITLLVFVATLLATNAFSQMDSASTAKWVKYMTPGKEHQWLAESDGTWTGEVTMWMAPNTEPMKSTSTSTNTMIMGGRYQQSVHKGDMGGMPFEGQSTVAYDNIKKVFIMSWIDNMGTGMMFGQGPWNEKTQSVTFKGKMVDPMTGKDCNFREVFKVVDKDHQLLQMYIPDKTGKEFKTMEIKYTRQ